MANFFTIVDLPERKNAFYNTMADILPQNIYNSGGGFIVRQIGPVTLRGRVLPDAVVKIFINNRDVSPTPDIVSDSNGDWTFPVILSQDQNVIQVQFFPPSISTVIDNFLSQPILSDMVLQSPTLFSKLLFPENIEHISVVGNFAYVAGELENLARFDLLTSVGIFLTDLTSPPVGIPRVIAADGTNVYVVQESDGKIARYDSALTTRLDLAMATKPDFLLVDGANLYSVRVDSVNVVFAKIDPATMLLVGAEVTIPQPDINHLPLGHLSFTSAVDDFFGAMFSLGGTFIGEDVGVATFYEGTPPIAPDSVDGKLITFKRIRKSDFVEQNSVFHVGFNIDANGFRHPTSIVHIGGSFYFLVQSNPGKILKMQESGSDMIVQEVIPLPFDTTHADGKDKKTVRMVLGSDGKLYVAANGNMARVTPGSSNIETIANGVETIAIDTGFLASVDSSNIQRVTFAPPSIFDDRAVIQAITVPSVPTNVRCRAQEGPPTDRLTVAWDLAEGSAYIIESQNNGGGFTERGREFFGDGIVMGNSEAVQGSFKSGDVIDFRVKAFNVVGESAPSALASITIPFVTPLFNAPTVLVVTDFQGTTIDISWVNNEGAGTLVQIFRQDAGVGGFNLIDTISSSFSVFADTGLLPGTLYEYKLKAIGDTFGFIQLPSVFSNLASANTFPEQFHEEDTRLLQPLQTEDPGFVIDFLLEDFSQSPPQTADAFDNPTTGLMIGDVAWAGTGNIALSPNKNFFRIDYSTNTVLAIVFNARSIAHDGSSLWVVQRDGDTLFRLNPITLAITGSIPSPPEDFLSVFWDGAELWTVQQDGTLSRVNRTTLVLEVVGNGGGVPSPSSFIYGIVKLGGFIYSIAEDKIPIRILKVNPTTLMIDDTIELALDNIRDLYTDGTNLFVSRRDSYDFWEIDPLTKKVVNAINPDISGGFESNPGGIPLADGSGIVIKTKEKVVFSGPNKFVINNSQGELIFTDEGTKVALSTFNNTNPNPNRTIDFTRYPTASLNEVHAANPVALVVPADPTGIVLTPIFETVKVDWTDNASAISAYRIERKIDAGPFVEIETVSGFTPTFIDDSPPPLATLTYRVTAFNTAGDSGSIQDSIVSPVTDIITQINDANASRVSYAAAGTTMFAAYDDAGVIRAKKITLPAHTVTPLVLDLTNPGGQIRRLLSDGTHIYTVTEGSPVTIKKFDLNGIQVGPAFSVVGTTLDATIGAGFIWFPLGNFIKKLTTSDMATVTTFQHVGNTEPYLAVTTDGSFLYTGYASTVEYRKFDLTDADVADSDIELHNNIFKMAVGLTNIAVTNQRAGDNTPQLSAIKSSDLTSGGVFGSGVDFRGVHYSAANDRYYVIEDIPGPSARILKVIPTTPLTLDTDRFRDVDTAQRDDIARADTRVFVTITDGTATSGFSILSIVL